MTTIEEITSKLERGEELTSYESGYHMGYTAAMADVLARQAEHGQEGSQ